MKKLAGVLSLVVLMVMLFTASMAEAGVYGPKLKKLYLEGVNQIGDNVLSGMDTPREWDLNLVFKTDMFELKGLATIGTRIDVFYTPDNSLDSVGLTVEAYVKPFGLDYIELGVRHNGQNVSDLNFNDGYAAFFRVGWGI